MTDWLSGIPYGGYGAPTRVGLGPGDVQSPTQGAFDPNPVLVGGLLVIGLGIATGGGALIGWLIARSTQGALIGALTGLGLTSANLAMNTARLASLQAAQETRQLPEGSRK